MTTNDNLKNIFLMPCGAVKAKENFNNTVLCPVKQATILSALPEEIGNELEAIFAENDIAVWGSVDGRNNRLFFNKMQTGDYILFSVGQQVKIIGQIALKSISSKLSKVLWPVANGRIYSLIYFINGIVKVNTPLSKVFAALGYKKNYVVQGLTSVSSERLKAFYESGQDIFSLVTDTKKEKSK